MERPRQSTLFFAAAAASVTAYELLCGHEELITNRVSENMETPLRRALTMSAIGMTALHLTGGLDRVKWLDPYHHTGKLRRITRPDDV